MSNFISYAQNFEDVMLHRALGHVKDGFYIDVGADDPVELSVTKAFYDRGWRGMNIEPVASKHAKFEQTRQRDINLHLLAGSTDGESRFFEFVGSPLSTMDEAIARQHAATGRWEMKEYMVPATTVDKLCAKHQVGGIHFLKVDVEGAEKIVLEGMTFDKYRPWIVVVESTIPLSAVENHDTWEPLLLGRRYSCVYADGLNRFYIAAEHPELKTSFAYPPSIHDNFICNREVKLQEQIAALKAQIRKGPFRLRQLVRNPRAFVRETFGLQGGNKQR